MTKVFELIINTNKRIVTIAVLVFWLTFVIINFINAKEIHGKDYFFAIISVFVFTYLLWICFGSVKLILNNEELIIEKRIYNVSFARESFDLRKIENVVKQVNDNADTTWFMRLIVNKNPVVIYFDFNGHSKKIGEGLEEFNADKIVSEIKNRKRELLG